MVVDGTATIRLLLAMPRYVSAWPGLDVKLLHTHAASLVEREERAITPASAWWNDVPPVLTRQGIETEMYSVGRNVASMSQ